MIRKPFLYYRTENDPEDFKMPYKLFGKFDKEVMFRKYQGLSNIPTHYLERRW
ncbi:MAG: hypothetical protein KME60_07105 [Cyanomargarita calcarea GSE-NOS-MK-12-04C]|jgi:hypothetical protein|uniref:Uncharacterized protein n=1 Tax=Cyanomargarita calcarea GSE-NOS-MK-12-04C TaxID=2839659 RepID=A0A951QJG6_9CYAN|nr:hypothetical protein [Cyanomargarita calcarea GSE-NOS-MK-12-04C]